MESKKRQRDRREYEKTRYLTKKDREMEKRREKQERYHMEREDVRVAAATLAPSSTYDISPSSPSFAPSHDVEDDLVIEEQPRYAVGDILLLEANTNGRG